MSVKKFDVTKLLAPIVLVVLYAFFSVFGNNFFSKDYLMNILDGSYYIGYMAIGVTFVIITAGIDLSLGTNFMCAALLGGYAYNVLHWEMAWCLLLVIVIGAALGFLNGLMIAYLKLPPFIATLGMMMMGMGFGAIVTNVQTMRFPTFGSVGSEFKTIFYKTAADSPVGAGFPLGAIWLVLFFIVAVLLLNKTKFGRYTYAIGSNIEAARLSGIKTRPWLTAVYTFCGLCSGLAGVMYAAVYTSIIPSTGNGQELLGIAGAVIGGTSMSGGSGTLLGTMIGVFIMSVLKQGLMSMGLQSHWQTFFTGVVVIGAVLLDQYRIKQSNRIKKA
jgi:ribose transport system permease protein